MSEPDPLFLPRAEEAVVPAGKLRDYALNPKHSTGTHKARVFASALGIARSDWEFLRHQIVSRVGECPVSAIRPKPPYGIEYELRIEVDGRNGETHQVITGWLVPEGGAPRLTTAYVETPRRA